MPDLSADADPYSGYLLYEPSFVAIGSPTLQGGWGGTSFVAPTVQRLRRRSSTPTWGTGSGCGTRPCTPPRAAPTRRSPRWSQASTSNDNIYYTGNPGQPYNQGAGLGYPNLTELAGDFGR